MDGREFHHRGAVVDETEMDFGKTQCEPLDDLADMPELRRRAFEEFLSGGRVEEKIGNFNHRARRPRSLALVRDQTGFQPDLSSARSAWRSGYQANARNRGNAGKGFAAKTERANREEVGVRPNLACGVAEEGARRIRLSHALPVIRHANMTPSRLGHLDGDPARARVNGVFDEFFD